MNAPKALLIKVYSLKSKGLDNQSDMETILSLNDALDTATFYGVNNINILCLKNQHPDVRIVARGYQVKVICRIILISFPCGNITKTETQMESAVM